MTLAALLALAHEQLASTDPDDDHFVADSLASGIVDLLGESAPCGYPPPIVYDGLLTVGAGRVTPSELRALCAMWLQAADCCEQESK